MAHEGFICPDCGAEVDIQKKPICECGLNLLVIRKFEKKTFYQELEYCASCGIPGNLVEEPGHYETEDEGNCSYYVHNVNCRSCGYTERREGQHKYNPPSIPRHDDYGSNPGM